MKRIVHSIKLSMICGAICLSLVACSKPKEGKVIITDQEFFIRHDVQSHANNWVIDAKGKVKNIGEVDVKNVVVSGYCLSCGEAIVSNTWFISNVDKMPHQKATIAYLPAGAEAEFNFSEVAFMMANVPPQTMPEKMECRILSFETVQN